MASLMKSSAIDIFIFGTFVCAFTNVLFRNRPFVKPRRLLLFEMTGPFLLGRNT